MDSIIRRRQHGYDYNESKVGFYYGPRVYLLNCNTFERVITVGFEANLKTYLVATESLYIFFYFYDRILFLYFRYRLIVRKLWNAPENASSSLYHTKCLNSRYWKISDNPYANIFEKNNKTAKNFKQFW